MLLFYGRRNKRIKNYNDSRNSCPHCKVYDLNVKVFREYGHVYFIPFFPAGDNAVLVRCNNCGEPVRTESIIREYESAAKTPIYLYAGWIIPLAFILFIVDAQRTGQQEKQAWLDKPQVGDVYKMVRNAQDTATYYFLRVSGVDTAGVTFYHSSYVYHRLPGSLDQQDHFDKGEQLTFTKAKLRKMLEDEEIYAIERGYDEATGFNRIE